MTWDGQVQQAERRAERAERAYRVSLVALVLGVLLAASVAFAQDAHAATFPPGSPVPPIYRACHPVKIPHSDLLRCAPGHSKARHHRGGHR